MHPILILTRNNLELTKKCVASVRRQTVDTLVGVIDNGSSDDTLSWLKSEEIMHVPMGDNRGVSSGWNDGLKVIFAQYDYCLVVNNDTILPPWFYLELLSYNVSFVTGYSTEDMKEIGPLFHHEREPLRRGPDMSAFLIRRYAWETIGPFDETMVHYCSDLDYDIRAHRKGIPLLRANLPFYHERSSTLKRASPEDRLAIQKQADEDRRVFKEKWGCEAGGPTFAAMFTSETYGVEAVQNLE